MTEAGEQGRAAREAAEWLARLNSRSVSTEELNDFYEWRRNPENANAYARGEQLWHDSRSLGDDRDIAAAVREALERPRLKGAVGGARWIGRRSVLAGGGALLAIVATGWLLGRADHYRTAVGEQLLVNLDDGSRMRLNTDSEVELRFSSSRRQVELEQGQIFLDVSHDPVRPFTVRAGNVDVVAVGTQFDVRILPGGGTRVILAEGRVAVSPDDHSWRSTLDTPGEALTASGSGRPQLARLDLEAATSWTVGRLTFRDTPLEEAIAEVNRYSQKQISLDVPGLRRLEVDGVFETGDPDAFVSALVALFPLRVRQVSSERIVLTGT